jgi:chaperonin GroES
MSAAEVILMQSLIIIGDRVLIHPEDPKDQTPSGLYLPATVREKDKIQSGRVVKTGPGHLIPNPEYSDAEPWAPERPPVRYLPLQAEPGDFALFLRKEAIELIYDEEKYLIVPHHALLAVVRPDPPDERDIYGRADLEA